MLRAERHPIAREVVVVRDLSIADEDGNVVYRYNEKHDVGTRTHHVGPRRPLRELRAAAASVAA